MNVITVHKTTDSSRIYLVLMFCPLSTEYFQLIFQHQ